MRDEEKRNISWIKRMQGFPFCESDRDYHARRDYERMLNEELEMEIQKAYEDVQGKETPGERQLISESYELGDW